MSQPTCADRISESLANTEETLKEVFARVDGEVISDDMSEAQSTDNAYEELWNYGLGTDTKKITKITLSYGGPASYIEVTHDSDGIDSMVYRFSDWFDTATEAITDEDSAIWRYAAQIIDAQEGNL